MTRHIHDGHLLAVSGSIPGARPVTVVVAGNSAETQAEKLLADIRSPHPILWCTPAHNSLTSELMVRRLFTESATLEWGPPLSISDRPEIATLIEDLSRDLGEA